jgi:hypothetical protein
MSPCRVGGQSARGRAAGERLSCGPCQPGRHGGTDRTRGAGPVRSRAQARSARGPLRRKAAIRSFSATAFLDFLIARFCVMDLPDLLLADCRGDLSDMTLLAGQPELPPPLSTRTGRGGVPRGIRRMQLSMRSQAAPGLLAPLERRHRRAPSAGRPSPPHRRRARGARRAGRQAARQRRLRCHDKRPPSARPARPATTSRRHHEQGDSSRRGEHPIVRPAVIGASRVG